jgi:hypothetical protein
MCGVSLVSAGPAPSRTRDQRVPLVRRCRLEFDDGRTLSAFLVNVSLCGAYVARDDLSGRAAGGRPGEAEADMPRLEQTARCYFTLPGREGELVATVAVSWINLRQQHPVHGLPPGYGLRILGMSPADGASLAALIAEHAARASALA